MLQRNIYLSPSGTLVELPEIPRKIPKKIEEFDRNPLENRADTTGSEFSDEDLGGIRFAEENEVKIRIQSSADGLNLCESLDSEIKRGLHPEVVVAK